MAVENVVDLKLNFDDNGLVELQKKQLDLIQRQVKYQKEMKDAVNETLHEAVMSEKAYSDAIKENLGQLKAQDLQIKKTSSAAQLYERAVDKITDSLGQFKDRAAAAINGLKDYGIGIINSIKATTGFSKALNVLKLAFIGTGIGALILALGALVAVFTRTQSGANRVSQAMAGLGSAVDVVIGKLVIFGEKLIDGLNKFGKFAAEAEKKYSGLGNFLIKLIPGLNAFADVAKIGGIVFKGFGEEISKAAKEGAKIEKGYQELSKRTRELTIDQAESEKTLAKLTVTANNEALSAKQRIAATKAASAETQRILSKEIAIERERLRLVQADIALKKQSGVGTNDALEQDRADALARIKSLQADLINQQAEYSAGVRGISQAEQERIKKLQDAYKGLLGDLEKRLDKATITGEDGIEKLLAQRDVAIQELVDFQKTLEDAAQKAGVKIPEATKTQILSLYSEVEDEFVRQAAEFRKKNPFSIETFLSFDGKTNLDAAQKLGDDVVGLLDLGKKAKIKEIQKLGEKLGKDVTESVQKGLNDAELNATPLFQKIVNGLKQTFDVNSEQLGFITDQISSTISDLDGIIGSGTQKQITENERLIKSIEDRVKAAEEAYNVELKLQEDGFANSAKLKEDELREEQARLQRAQQKKEELEKRALRQQLISDSLQQASQLALGAAKVITAESGKGLIGIITAAAGIALLFRIIAQAKANAAKFSTPPKFRGGGQLLEGPSHEQGGIPIVIGNSRVVEAEGGEFIIRKKSSVVNEEFFHRVNRGEYDHLNLTKTIEQANQGRELARRFNAMGETGSRIAAQYRARDNSSQNRATDKAISDRLDRLTYVVENVLETLQERPVIEPMDRPYRKTYRMGRIKYKETIRPKD